MKMEIPVMFCFDNNYVIPASVAFYSLLEHANRKYNYKFFVLHSDITENNQMKLKETIEQFSSFSSLEFIDMTHRFDDLWEKIKTKGHFSKEVMYKVLVASIFPQYEKIIVSDVDVLFLNDISESYTDFNVKDDVYLAGVKAVGKIINYMENYKAHFTDEEIIKLSGFCGGYIVFNLKKLREDNMEDRFIECFEKEGYRINQMEQDVLNLCCYPKTTQLHLKYVACSYMWDLYKIDEDFDEDLNYSREELEEAMNDTVQLHYATSIKPWKNVDSTKSEEWFKYIVKTPFLKEYLQSLPNKIVIPHKENTATTLFEKMISLIKKLFIYIRKNPFFILTPKFYNKLLRIFKTKILKKSLKEIPLLILDDHFPSENSGSRYYEYLAYLNSIYGSQAILTDGLLQTEQNVDKYNGIVEKFLKVNPEYKNRIKASFDDKRKVAIAIVSYLNNLFNNFNFFQKNEISFVFTLCTGNGFHLNDSELDNKLQEVFSSPLFRNVIVNEEQVRDYLTNNKICNENQIIFIPGNIISAKLLEKKKTNKKYFSHNKQTLDVCIMINENSIDEEFSEYKRFLQIVDKLLAKNLNIMFHVISSLNEKKLQDEKHKDRIKFYEFKKIEHSNSFYQDKDIIIFSARKANNFSAIKCVEAILNHAVVLCDNDFSSSLKLKMDEGILLQPNRISDIAKKIEFCYNNPNKLKSTSKKGYRAVKKQYSYKKQILTRINLIEKLIKKEMRNRRYE